MNIEQVAGEQIARRTCTPRKLTLAEVAEFKGTVLVLLRARCRYGDWCWQPGCPRCDPDTAQ